MATWSFEPGHTAAEFSARHMMVTRVRGTFKNLHGALEFDADNPALSSVEVAIDAATLWSGEPSRDDHLRSADFLDVENHPQITFKGDQVEVLGENDYVVTGDLTIRGVTKQVPLRVRYLGSWQTPWWEEIDGEWVDKGPKTRAGFEARTEIDRHDFGVSWNDAVGVGGMVVSRMVAIDIDVEAIWESE